MPGANFALLVVECRDEIPEAPFRDANRRIGGAVIDEDLVIQIDDFLVDGGHRAAGKHHVRNPEVAVARAADLKIDFRFEDRVGRLVDARLKDLRDP